jgi:hypothetical protein
VPKIIRYSDHCTQCSPIVCVFQGHTRIRYRAKFQHYSSVLLPEGATAAVVTSSEVSDSGAYSTCWAEGSLGSAVRLLTYIGRNVHSKICGEN